MGLSINNLRGICNCRKADGGGIVDVRVILELVNRADLA